MLQEKKIQVMIKNCKKWLGTEQKIVTGTQNLLFKTNYFKICNSPYKKKC